MPIANLFTNEDPKKKPLFSSFDIKKAVDSIPVPTIPSMTPDKPITPLLPQKTTPTFQLPDFKGMFESHVNNFNTAIREQTSKIPKLQKSNIQVRNQDWYDVLNIAPQIAGGIIGSVASIVAGVGELVSGNKSLGHLPTIPAIGAGKRPYLEPIFQAEGYKTTYEDQIKAGATPKQAFWNTFLKTGIDLSVAIPVSRGISKSILTRTIPEKLVTSENIKVDREQVRDYLTGRDTNLPEVPTELKEAISHTINTGTREEKNNLFKFGTTNVEEIKPSRLGKLVGITEDEARNILNKIRTNPTPHPEQQAFLPSGENIKQAVDEVAQQFQSQPAFKEKPIGIKPNGISKDLEPLAQEAKKYATPEEFIQALQNEKGGIGSGVDYTPGKRLAETQINDTPLTNFGFKPEDKVTIYRGVDRADQKDISAGDYIATSPELAASYTGSGKVISKIVPASAIRFSSGDGITEKDFSKGFNATHLEAVYNPNPPLKKDQLIELHKKVTKEKPSFKKTEKKAEVPQEVGAKKLEAYKKRLKLNFDTKLVDTIFTGAIHDGEVQTAYGVMFDNTIALADKVTAFTADHEVGHLIFRNLENIPLFKGITREDLLTELQAKYPDMKTDSELEEQLQSDFEDYVRDREAGKKSTFTGKIKRFFEKLYNQIKKMLRSLSGKPKSKIEDLYKRTTEGTGTKEVTLKSTGKFPEGKTIKFTDGAKPRFSEAPSGDENIYQKITEKYGKFPETIEEVNAMDFEDISAAFHLLPVKVQYEIAGFDPNDYNSTPQKEVVMAILNGDQKLRTPDSIATEAKDALGKGLYYKIFRRNDMLSTADEVATDLGFASDMDLIYAIRDAAEARATVRQLVKEEKARLRAEQKTKAEQEKALRKFMKDMIGEVATQKTTEGAATLKTVKEETGQTDTSKEITKTERQLLKDKLKAESKGARVGFKAGTKEARQSILKQLTSKFENKIEKIERAGELKDLKTKIITRDYDRVKTEIIDYAKETLPISERGKFITMVGKAKSQKDLIKAFTRIDLAAEKYAVKEGIATLKKTVEKLSESPSVSVDYRTRIKEIIDEYELTGHSEKTMEKLQATQDFLDRTEDAELPQSLLNKLKILGRVPKDELTLSQIQGLQQQIELLGAIGKAKFETRQRLYDMEKAGREERLLEEATPINSKAKPTTEVGEPRKKWVDKYIKLRNYVQKSSVSLMPIDGLAEITGMEPMKHDLDLSFGNYLPYNDGRFEKLHEIIDRNKLTQGNVEKVGVYAIAQQDGGLDRLVQNNKIPESTIKEITLNEGEAELYNYIVEENKKGYPIVKKLSKDLYNVDVGEIKNYVSFHSDIDQMNDLEIYDRFGVRPEDALTQKHFTKNVESGFIESRQKMSSSPLQLDVVKVFQRHWDDVAWMDTMARDIKMYSEIVNSPELRVKLGDVGTLAWREWLDLMARKGGQEGAKRIAILDALRKNIAAGVLSFRLSSALVQFSSFADTMGTIGGEWASKGAYNIATSREWRNFIMDNFPEVRKAVGDDIAFRELDEGYLGKIGKAGLKPLQFLDGMMRSTAASGAYEKLATQKGIAVDLANPDQELIAEATKLMRQSQGSSFFKDQPLAISTGMGFLENRSLNKTIFTFQSFMLNRWDNIKRQIWRQGIKEKNFKKAFLAFFWLIVFAAAMEESIRRGTRAAINAITGDQTPEQPFLDNSVMNVVQSVPLVGQLASSISYSSNPVPVLNTFQEVISGIGSATTGKASSTKARGVVQAAGAIGTLAGIPGISQVAQIARKAIPKAKGGSSSGSTKLKPLPKLKSLKQKSALPKLKTLSL